MAQLVFDDDHDDGDERRAGGPQRTIAMRKRGGVCNADRKSRTTASTDAAADGRDAKSSSSKTVAVQGSAWQFGLWLDMG